MSSHPTWDNDPQVETNEYCLPKEKGAGTTVTYTKVELASGGSAIRSLQTGAFDLLLVNRASETPGNADMEDEDGTNQ